uniref:CPG4 domain-containing protein n=1 Tax=Caenorhabditis tropicalis TaxID=1561998 RepID=A0A1I7UI00_9PELO
MDNLEKVSDQIGCIQEKAGDLQQECETECAVQADLIDKAAKNNADQLFNMEKLCNSTSCVANCYQNNLHKYCDIGEDNVLDTIFAQFETLQEQNVLGYLQKEKQNTTGIAKLLGMMMPEECNSDKFKIKIPKKIDLTNKPKSVGSPPEVRKDTVTSKKSLATSRRNITETDAEAALMAKSGNLSSAALMFNGKIQTLQCQFRDSYGNPQKTPDFESLSKILSEHFNKGSTSTTPKPSDAKRFEKNIECRNTSNEPQPRNTGSITMSTPFWLTTFLILYTC